MADPQFSPLILKAIQIMSDVIGYQWWFPTQSLLHLQENRVTFGWIDKPDFTSGDLCAHYYHDL